MTIQQILTKYWGHTAFRPLQEDIIHSVMQGKDTLALLPTGGGKSICFQVPAMAMEGICIVISPLIALMKDQVENLIKAGIPSAAVYSGMHNREIDVTLDNCVYGNIKFLYLSPERLGSEMVRIRIKKMKVSLFAVDEAHCISQWGYDFRPSYLRIAEIKELHPNAVVIALTATATPEVVKDIQQKLLFKSENLFQISFERKNLSYVVLEEDDKLKKLIKIINSVQGSGIVYARNRKKTQEIAELLRKHKITADYYHAGLDHETRSAKQEAWMKNKIRVITATNAFGMGIDKSNVRFVIHLEPPDCLESYFQEAGRAGRDGLKAYAVMIYNKSDKRKAEGAVKMNFPAVEEIKKVYQLLGNYFQIALGSGEGAAFDFDINEFCSRFKLKVIVVFSAIKFLEKEGYISVTDAKLLPSRLMFRTRKQDLYNFQVENKQFDGFIKLLLRAYGGMFDDFVKISEHSLAKRANLPVEEIIKKLSKLDSFNILSYFPQNKMPQIVFAQPRVEDKYFRLSAENYALLKKSAVERLKGVLDYASGVSKCRSQLLLSYFGENDSYRCGICDVCLERNKLQLSDLEFASVLDQIKPLILKSPITLSDLVDSIKEVPEDKTLKVIRWLLDTSKIKNNEDNKLYWNKG